ncbi:MAG: Rdx family protein [Dehalococcoidia bacterium]|nr:Rdx family protein [Dehalococcoidia bacterium]
MRVPQFCHQAGAVEKEFGAKVALKGGHGGIFEVSLNGQAIYTNHNQCGRIPTEEEIFSRIRQGEEPKDETDSESCSCGGG